MKARSFTFYSVYDRNFPNHATVVSLCSMHTILQDWCSTWRLLIDPSFGLQGDSTKQQCLCKQTALPSKCLVQATFSERTMSIPILGFFLVTELVSLLLSAHERKVPGCLLMRKTTSYDPVIFLERIVPPVIRVNISSLWLRTVHAVQAKSVEIVARVILHPSDDSFIISLTVGAAGLLRWFVAKEFHSV